MERSYGIPHKENEQDHIHQQEMLKRNPLRIIKPGDPDFERTAREIMENQQNDKKTPPPTPQPAHKPAQKSAKKLIKCKSCGAETHNHGRGLCPKCYRREEREGTLDANYPSNRGGNQKEHCAECGALTRIESRGMCRKCYQRWHYHNKRKAKTAGTQRVEQAKENLRKNLDKKKGERAQSRVGTAHQGTKPKPDAVNHPTHYTVHPSGIECIDITEHMNFCTGNAIKYIWRAGQKGDPIQDLEKALWYIRREIKRMKEAQA
jgi:hypothetical protein